MTKPEEKIDYPSFFEDPIKSMLFLERLTEEDIRRNTREYDDWMEARRPDGWTQEDKNTNYSHLIKIARLSRVPLKGASCLDVGCGTGNLAVFLRRRRISRYLGVDLYTPAIHLARIKYPHEEFVEEDFLTFETDERFDFAFLSGAISLKLESSNHAFVKAMAAKMWQLTRAGFAMNFLMSDSPYASNNPYLRFYSIPEIEGLCREVAPNALIRNYEHPTVYQGNVFVYRAGSKNI